LRTIRRLELFRLNDATTILDKIDHIGIVVENLDGALRQFTEVPGLTCLEIKEIESIGLRTAFFNFLDWEGGPFMRYALGDILEIHTAPCACGMPGIRFKIVGRADEMLIVKGVNVYPGAIKNAIEKFFPRTTGALRILLDRPGPLVSPPLKIRLEHSTRHGFDSHQRSGRGDGCSLSGGPADQSSIHLGASGDDSQGDREDQTVGDRKPREGWEVIKKHRERSDLGGGTAHCKGDYKKHDNFYFKLLIILRISFTLAATALSSSLL